jgi:predicted Fe-Mo cluster-binding NifX family protein
MDEKIAVNTKITSEKAMEILKRNGLKVTVGQAQKILELLSVLAKIEVEQYLKR